MSVSLRNAIFNIRSGYEFEQLALGIFNFQFEGNTVYRQYVSRLGISPAEVDSLDKIPFLPVEFFRNHVIVTGPPEVKILFESSGTTGDKTSRHYVTDVSLYEESFFSAFRLFYGDPSVYSFAALLPSYSARKNSSLLYMVDSLIKVSHDSRSGFYHDKTEALPGKLAEMSAGGNKVMLIGVSFALLDLAEKFSPDLKGITVVETGGMKGRRKEITREELHSVLESRFNIETVHSEYGMTELLSQAWSKGGGVFSSPPWMRVMIRDPHDPLSVITEPGITGGINVIDLANIYSCSFIATGDLGRLNETGSFEVLGRFDSSDIRGCNLLF